MEPISLTICVLTIVFGGGYGVKKITDSYNKNQKNKKRKLELKGKSIERAREENKRLTDRNKEIENKLKQGEEKEREVEKQISDVKKELEDPNISKERERELRNTLVFLQTQLDDIKINNKNYRDEIKKNSQQMKDNRDVINNTVSNLDDKHWVWDLITLENIMIAGACYVAYKLLKDDDK